MALKPDRKFTDGTDISYFMTQATQRGCAVIFSGAGGGSGAAMDDPNAIVCLPTGGWFGLGGTVAGSGQTVAGILLTDVVNVDLTKYHLNQHQDQVQVGGKVTLLRRGECLTNMIYGNVTPGQIAIVVDNTGNMSGLSLSAFSTGIARVTDLSQWHKIGTWKSAKDADGYAKLEVNLV